MKSKSGTLRSTKSSASNYSEYNSDDPSKPTKTDLLTSKARGSVYNSTVGISSSFGPRTDETSVPVTVKPIERTATLQKYNTLGRRPLPLTPDEIKQSKETPIPRVPDEMPLSAANLTQYRSLQRTGRGPYGSHFNSLYRIQQGKPIAAHPPQIPQMHQQQMQQHQLGQDKNSQTPTQEPVYSNNESERQLYAVTEL